MRYTKFFIDQTISRIKSNPTVRKTATGGYRALHGSGKLGLKGIAAIFSILLHPATMMIGAGIVGIYIFTTVLGNMNSVMMNMTSSSSGGVYSTSVASVYGSSFNALSSVNSLLPLVVMTMIIGVTLFSITGLFGGIGGMRRDYGAM